MRRALLVASVTGLLCVVGHGVYSGMQNVQTLSAAEMRMIRGGEEICYIPSLVTCGQSPIYCPTHKCDYLGGQVFACNDVLGGPNRAYGRIQPAHDHYLESSEDGQEELTNPIPEFCNYVYQCECYDDGFDYWCDDPSPEESPSAFNGVGAFTRREPTGDYCEFD